VVQANGRIQIKAVKRDLPQVEGKLVPIAGKIPEDHAARLHRLTQDSGYKTSELLRLAVAHFLNTVTIIKEEPTNG
jgi:hypothetical protein